jgi:hypothetical protein
MTATINLLLELAAPSLDKTPIVFKYLSGHESQRPISKTLTKMLPND